MRVFVCLCVCVCVCVCVRACVRACVRDNCMCAAVSCPIAQINYISRITAAQSLNISQEEGQCDHTSAQSGGYQTSAQSGGGTPLHRVEGVHL